MDPSPLVDAFDDPVQDGPFAFVGALEQARPRIRAEAVLWFIGVVLVLAGSLYFTESNWDRWSGEVRAIVVTAGLVGYQALFVALGAFLATRRAPALPTRVFAGLGAALVGMIGWASSALFVHAPILTIILAACSSALVFWAAHTVETRAGVDTRGWLSRRLALAGPAAATLAALTVCRAAPWLTTVAAAFALVVIGWSVWTAWSANHDSTANVRPTIGAVYGGYLLVAATCGAASHPALAPVWVIAPALAWVAVVVHRAARTRIGEASGGARIVVVLSTIVAIVLAMTSNLVPIGGRVAVLFTAAASTYALWSTARNDDRRLPIALAVLAGLLVYFFLPAPFRALMDLLLASAKSALGYDDRPLPYAYYGLTFIPYLLACWLGAFRLRRTLAPTVRGLLFVIALVLVTAAAAQFGDPRPALFTVPLYAFVFAIDARKSQNSIALHAAALLTVIFAVRLAVTAFGDAAWPLGISAAGLLLTLFVRRTSNSPHLFPYAVGGAAFAIVAAATFWHPAIRIVHPAWTAGLGTLAFLHLTIRMNRARLAGATLVAAFITATLVFPSVPHVVATLAAIALFLLVLFARGATRRAAELLLPSFSLGAVVIGLVVGASPIAHLPTVVLAIVSPVVTRRPAWSVIGATAAATLVFVTARYFDTSPILPLAVLAALGLLLARTLRRSDAPKDLLARYDAVIMTMSGLIGALAAAAAVPVHGPIVGLQIAVTLLAILVMIPRRSIQTIALQVAIAIGGLTAAALVVDPTWVTTPAAAFVVIVVLYDRANTHREQLAGLTTAVAIIAISATTVGALAAILGVGAAALLALGRVPIYVRVAAGLAATVGAAAALGWWGLLGAAVLIAPLVVLARRDIPERVATEIGVVLAAGVVLLLWPLGLAEPVVFVAPAVVLLLMPLYFRHTVAPLAMGVGLALLGHTIAVVTGIDLSVTLTLAAAAATLVTRIWTLRVESADDRLTARIARLVAGALAGLALLTVFTSAHLDMSFAHAAWVGALFAMIFIATGLQVALAAALVAFGFGSTDLLFDFARPSPAWVALLWTAAHAALAMVFLRTTLPTFLVHRQPSPWVATVLALVSSALVTLALCLTIADGAHPSVDAILIATAAAFTAFFLRTAHPKRVTRVHALLSLPVAAGFIGFALAAWPGAAIGVATGAVVVHVLPGETNRTLGATWIVFATLPLAVLMTRLSTHGFATAVVLGLLTLTFGVTYRRRPRRDTLILTVLSAAAATSWSWFGVGRMLSTGRPEFAILPFVASGFAVVAALLGVVATMWTPARAAARTAYVDRHFYQPIRRTRYGLMLAAAVACLAHVALMASPSTAELVCEALVITSAVVFFVRRARDKQRTIDAFVVEGMLLLAWLFLRRQCGLFASIPNIDAYAMMFSAFLFSGIHVFVRRGILSPAFDRAAKLSALVLPVAAALLFEPDLSWRTAGMIGVASLAYAVAARARVSRFAAPLATIAFNVATIVAWLTAGVGDPQLYALPVGVSLLFLAHLYQADLSPRATAWIRLVALGGVYLSSFVSVLSFDAASHSLIMACIAVAGAVAGLILRVRSYLLLGAAFLLVDLGTSVVRFGLSGQTAATLVLTALGLALLGGLVVWSLNRRSITETVAAWGLELSEWEV